MPLPIPHSVGEGGGDGQPAIPIEVVMVDCGTATEAARRRQTHGIRRQTHEDGNTDDTSQTPTLSDGDTDGVPLSASHSVGEGGGEGQPAIPVEVVMTYAEAMANARVMADGVRRISGRGGSEATRFDHRVCIGEPSGWRCWTGGRDQCSPPRASMAHQALR